MDDIVCCMCGDIGFPDQLLRCIRCYHRYQHSYCNSFYDESEVCDWCRSKERTDSSHGGRSKKLHRKDARIVDQSEYSGGRMKQGDGEESCDKKGKSGSRGSSVRTTSRRYKLLKDVLYSTE